MKHFTGVVDVSDIEKLIREAIALKNAPYSEVNSGKNKTLGLLFLNPSLRTRISTQKAARNLGMEVMVMNVDKDGWALEFQEGTIMNGNSVEHVKDAAAVLGQYCDILGIRCFPTLTDKEKDYSEFVLNKFIRYAGVPILSLESATRHPLQSLADLISIHETWKGKSDKPKVVLTWAPHIKPLPQAVANSFSEWVLKAGYELTIAQPAGFELSDSYTKGALITNHQKEALKDADFIYVKNWSSYHEYGAVTDAKEWMLSEEKLKNSRLGKIMHCLPVRRNLELPDELIDSNRSMVLQQAANREWAAQVVLKNLISSNSND